MRTDEKRVIGRVLAVCCLLLFFYLTLDTALVKVLTSDEPSHIIRGVTLRQTGDLRFQLGHAPFSHRLIGSLLPLMPELPDVHQLSQWGSGDRLHLAAELIWHSGLDVDRLLLLVRLPIILLGILLGALVGSWALAWQGQKGMLVALIIFAASPNLIAHAALATTDMATTAVYFATAVAWWHFWHKRKMRWWALTAVLLGIALATKLTAILLLPVLFLQGVLHVTRVRDWWRPALAWGALLPIALLALWFVYGFEVGPFANWPFANWPLNLPAPSYLASWQTVLEHVDAGHRSFFWGELSKRGWWFYFPAAYAIKTPLVTLALLLITTIMILRRRDLWRTALFLLVPVGALFAAAIVSKLNIGYRHILPAVPFLLVYASSTARLFTRGRAARLALGLALIGLLFAAFWQHPDHLAYFNLAAGGTARGYHYLGDSNLDWGQDLKLLAQEVAARPGSWVISYDGVNDPAYYGLPAGAFMDAEKGLGTFAAANPPPARYAISVNHLQGLLPDADLFDWFRRQEPSDHLGGSIQVYEVEEQMKGQWIAQCVDPLPLLTAAEAETLLGTQGARHLFFDCRQSFVLPTDGAPGWIVLPQADEWWFERPLALDELPLVYRHDAAAGFPSLDVYYWPGTDESLALEGWYQDARLPSGDAVSLPYAPNDTAELVGYRNNSGDWYTLWRVQEQARQPLSIRAHLFTTEAGPPEIGDSLGFSSEQWQPGDWLLQQHSFPEPAGEVAFLQMGMYNYLTLEPAGEVVNLPAQMIEP